MLKMLLFAAIGAFLMWSGIRTLRTRAYENGVSVIELAILKATGSEPLPITKWDVSFNRTAAWLSIIFGFFFLALGIFVVGASILEAE